MVKVSIDLIEYVSQMQRLQLPHLQEEEENLSLEIWAQPNVRPPALQVRLVVEMPIAACNAIW